MSDLASQYEQKLRALQLQRADLEQEQRGDGRNYSLVGLRLVTVLNQLQALQAIQGIQELLPKDRSGRSRTKIAADPKERAQQRQWLMFKADWLEALLEDSVREIEALDRYGKTDDAPVDDWTWDMLTPHSNYGYWAGGITKMETACDAMAQLMIDALQLQPTDRLLECGVGNASSAVYIGKHHPPALYRGLEPQEVRAVTAKEVLDRNGFGERFRVQPGDPTRLPFDEASFDKVMSIESAFQFNTREDYLREAYRVLSPGGIIALTDIVLAPELRMSDWTMSQLREFLGADLKCIPDANIYSATRYEQILTEIGFQSVEIVSLKKDTILQFAEQLEQAAQHSPSPSKERRLGVAEHFRNQFSQAGDYIKVRALKPAR